MSRLILARFWLPLRLVLSIETLVFRIYSMLQSGLELEASTASPWLVGFTFLWYFLFLCILRSELLLFVLWWCCFWLLFWFFMTTIEFETGSYFLLIWELTRALIGTLVRRVAAESGDGINLAVASFTSFIYSSVTIGMSYWRLFLALKKVLERYPSPGVLLRMNYFLRFSSAISCWMPLFPYARISSGPSAVSPYSFSAGLGSCCV